MQVTQSLVIEQKKISMFGPSPQQLEQKGYSAFRMSRLHIMPGMCDWAYSPRLLQTKLIVKCTHGKSIGGWSWPGPILLNTSPFKQSAICDTQI